MIQKANKLVTSEFSNCRYLKGRLLKKLLVDAKSYISFNFVSTMLCLEKEILTVTGST